MRFEDLRLGEPILRAVRAAGYNHPTPIQTAAIPHVLAGNDVLGCAQTGTGKTAAFTLPILQRLKDRAPHAAGQATTHGHGHGDGHGHGHTGHRERGHGAPRAGARLRALVLCPTRELAAQIGDSVRTYGQHTGLRHAVIFGGVRQGPQVRAIQSGVDILVATPGRLLDLLGQGLVNLSGIEILVLDEADRMLDMGFIPDVRRILQKIPGQRQTLMFSATMPAPIRKLADDILREPVPVQVARVSSPTPLVKHRVHFVRSTEKSALLIRLLRQARHSRALVFTRTKRGADRLTKSLVQSGVSAAALHGNKSQGARTRALEEFRSARTPVLVATDIAARGLDVDDISHVYNYDLTPDAETYIHRIGRTGRAGATGAAISFCTNEDRGNLRAIERLLQAPLEQVNEPGEHGGHAGGPDRSTHAGHTGPKPVQHAAKPHHQGPKPGHHGPKAGDHEKKAGQPVHRPAQHGQKSQRSGAKRFGRQEQPSHGRGQGGGFGGGSGRWKRRSNKGRGHRGQRGTPAGHQAGGPTGSR